MATLRQYLAELVNQRNNLSVNLTAKGVPSLQSEKLNTLVPKVLDIVSGGSQLISKSIYANGVYRAVDDDADGYREVEVDVPTTSVQDIPSFSMCSNSDFIYEDGWVGPFSSSSRYIVPIANDQIVKPDWRQPFEIQVTFTVSGSVSRSQVLFGAVQNYYYCPSIELTGNLSGVWAGFSTSGRSWEYNMNFSTSEFPITLNREISAKASWDGQTYTVILSSDDTTVSKSITPSASHYYSSSYNLEFGGINQSSNHYARYVKINLLKSFLKQNSTLLWGVDS